MLPRFRTSIEKMYLKEFPKYDPTPFYVKAMESSYYNMLRDAIERKEPISKEEIVKLWGKEYFEKEVAYLKKWNALPKWIENAD